MSRKLASLRVVKQLLPIEGADLIELALVDGWQCVVQKGLYTPGCLAIYFEIDSFLPSTDSRYASFEERFINWGDKRGMRVKTIKLKKQLSQGLLMPLKEFPEITFPVEGDDVTALLGIEKWEPIEEAANNNGGTGVKAFNATRQFPSFVKKTDQDRVQNKALAIGMAVKDGEWFEESIKLDGSPLTAYVVQPNSPYYGQALEMKLKKKGFLGKLVHKFKLKFGMYKDPVFAVCSRNVQLKDFDGSTFWRTAIDNNLIEAILDTGRSLAFQGEMIGPNIQDNHEKVQDLEFYLFDIFDIDKQAYLLPPERCALAQSYMVPQVPISRVGPLFMEEVEDPVKSLLERAEGPGMNKGVRREGLVFKSTTRDFSFKAISNSYLLKKG